MSYTRLNKRTKQPTPGTKGENNMTIEEMKAYIKEELKEEYKKLLDGEPNHYSYLFMIANDMGLTE